MGLALFAHAVFHLTPREILAMADEHQAKVAKVDKNNHEGGDEQSGKQLINVCFCRFFITTESPITCSFWYKLIEPVYMHIVCRVQCTKHVKCGLSGACFV